MFFLKYCFLYASLSNLYLCSPLRLRFCFSSSVYVHVLLNFTFVSLFSVFHCNPGFWREWIFCEPGAFLKMSRDHGAEYDDPKSAGKIDGYSPPFPSSPHPCELYSSSMAPAFYKSVLKSIVCHFVLLPSPIYWFSFIKSFKLNRGECLDSSWPTFNRFFSRRLKPDARPVWFSSSWSHLR